MSKPKGVVLFPGAGSSADHSSLVRIEREFARTPVARVDFPYRRAGRRAPDRAPVLVKCVKDEVRSFAREHGVRTSSLVIGGRSMGGRMCSMAVADIDDALVVKGLVVISYPLHPPAKPETLRTEHLPRITVPTLVLSGTKDTFGSPKELRSALRKIKADVTFHFVEGKGHDLKGCDDDIARVVAEWSSTL